MRVQTVTGGGGIKLYVQETGSPNGRPILFIHGFSQSSLAWSKQMESDLADKFRLVALDIRGHGFSDKPLDAYGDSQLWADDIQAVIQTLGLERPILSGWSYGGLIICDYLRAYGEDQISGINFVGAVSRLGSDAALAVIGPEFLQLVPGLFSTDAEESVQALATFLRLCAYEEASPHDFFFALGYNAVVPPSVRQSLFSRQLENEDVLSGLRKPVLITHGEQDAVVLLEAAKQHTALIPHAKTAYYPNIGHSPFWEDAPRFNQDLREFVQAAP